MSELTCLELSVVLWLVHVLVQATVGNASCRPAICSASRDKPAAATRGLLFGRATRALANYVENFTPFVAVALALMVTGEPAALARSARQSGSWRASSTFRFTLRHYLRPHGGMGDLDRRPRDDAGAIGRMVAGAASLSRRPAKEICNDL